MDLDSIIFLLFLLAYLFVSIRAIKHPPRPYAHFTAAHTITAILAVTYGGEVLCNPLHIDGLLYWAGSMLSYFIIGNLLANRFHLVLNTGSVAEIMGRLYGNPIRKIVALSGILHSAAVAAMQCKLLSMAIGWCFAMQSHYSLLIAALLIMLPVGSNQIHSPTLVRVARCAAFGILLPLIAWILWNGMATHPHGDQTHLTLAIKECWDRFRHAAPLNYMVYGMAFALPAFYPAQVAPILIAENATQVKRTFNSAGLLSLSINLLLLWVALLAQKNAGKLMPSVMTSFEAYLGLKGLFMIGVAALTLSTAGTNLHAATRLITNDLPDLFKWVKNPMLYQAMVGMMAMLIALYTQEQLIAMAIILFKTMVSLPLLLSLVGITLHPYAVLAGMLAGGLTTITWSCCIANPGMWSLLPAMVMNLLSMLVIQFFKGKRSANPPHCTNRLAQDPVVKPPPLWKRLSKHILTRPFNLGDYPSLPKHHLPYILFGFYILLTGYGSLYTFTSHPIWHARLEAFILLPSLFVATLFFIHPFIAQRPYIRKIASVIWPLSHVYFLFLVGTGMATLSKFSYLYTTICILNLLLSIFITPLIVLLTGCIMSSIVVWTLRHYMDGTVALIDYPLDLNLHIAYALLMLFIFVGGFLYHTHGLGKRLSIIQTLTSEKEEQNARQFFNKQQVEVLAYESNWIISQLNHQLMRLDQSEERPLAYTDQALRLKKYFNSIFQHLKYNLHLVTNWISIDQLLAECFDTITISNIYDTPYVMINTKHLYIQCAIESIKNLIISSLYACSTHESLHSDQKKDIYIHIDDTQLGYRLTLLQGKLQKINAISFCITTATRLPAIAPTYKVAEMADIQILDAHEEKIDSENQHIVHAHYGYYERFCSASEITHLYVIPVNVQEITKAFATLSPVVYTQTTVLDPISIQAEATFLEKVKQKKGLKVDAVMDALQLIKIYYTTQRRKTGELFYLHPMAVASILLTITEDTNVIIAGLVHDVVQNTPFTEAGLTTLFGPAITETVWAAARLEKELPNKKEDYATYIEQIIGHTKQDAILVRLADVLHNARTIAGHAIEKQLEKIRLIQHFYLPLAIQLQLVDITDELQLHAERVSNIPMVKP
ncbi:HD domain-containing protein [Candidatus Cardinium sp. TP]|uniref:HD domain-containing protein n=1 Tax=Candidatus Cardinium sp. TP TaxID=2961955 RepID=UPI0021AF478F|nr:HD domain-containing protein [Candidatus Cardinium sp. TP]MCT4696827.1 HD domain-containing protein [Candidatus Cardinium sp. TP]